MAQEPEAEAQELDQEGLSAQELEALEIVELPSHEAMSSLRARTKLWLDLALGGGTPF